MAEPETEGTELSLRAAEVVSDVSETDKPEERRLVVSRFTRAVTSGARAARPRYAGRAAARG